MSQPPSLQVLMFEGEVGEVIGSCAGGVALVNDQFRVCFVWMPEGPKDVEIVDYH